MHYLSHFHSFSQEIVLRVLHLTEYMCHCIAHSFTIIRHVYQSWAKALVCLLLCSSAQNMSEREQASQIFKNRVEERRADPSELYSAPLLALFLSFSTPTVRSFTHALFSYSPLAKSALSLLLFFLPFRSYLSIEEEEVGK